MHEVVARQREERQKLANRSHEQEDLSPARLRSVAFDERRQKNTYRHRPDHEPHEKRHLETYGDVARGHEHEGRDGESERDGAFPFAFDAVEVNLHPDEEHEIDETELREKMGRPAFVHEPQSADGEPIENFRDGRGHADARRHHRHDKGAQIENDERKGFSQLHARARGKRAPERSSCTVQ